MCSEVSPKRGKLAVELSALLTNENLQLTLSVPLPVILAILGLMIRGRR